MESKGDSDWLANIQEAMACGGEDGESALPQHEEMDEKEDTEQEHDKCERCGKPVEEDRCVCPECGEVQEAEDVADTMEMVRSGFRPGTRTTASKRKDKDTDTDTESKTKKQKTERKQSDGIDSKHTQTRSDHIAELKTRIGRQKAAPEPDPEVIAKMEQELKELESKAGTAPVPFLKHMRELTRRLAQQDDPDRTKTEIVDKLRPFFTPQLLRYTLEIIHANNATDLELEHDEKRLENTASRVKEMMERLDELNRFHNKITELRVKLAAAESEHDPDSDEANRLRGDLQDFEHKHGTIDVIDAETDKMIAAFHASVGLDLKADFCVQAMERYAARFKEDRGDRDGKQYQDRHHLVVIPFKEGRRNPAYEFHQLQEQGTMVWVRGARQGPEVGVATGDAWRAVVCNKKPETELAISKHLGPEYDDIRVFGLHAEEARVFSKYLASSLADPNFRFSYGEIKTAGRPKQKCGDKKGKNDQIIDLIKAGHDICDILETHQSVIAGVGPKRAGEWEALIEKAKERKKPSPWHNGPLKLKFKDTGTKEWTITPPDHDAKYVDRKDYTILVIGPPDGYKTTAFQEAIAGTRYYMGGDDERYPNEHLDGEELIIYDDAFPTLKVLKNVSNRWEKKKNGGESRYQPVWLKPRQRRKQVLLCNLENVPHYVTDPSFDSRVTIWNLFKPNQPLQALLRQHGVDLSTPSHYPGVKPTPQQQRSQSMSQPPQLQRAPSVPFFLPSPANGSGSGSRPLETAHGVAIPGLHFDPEEATPEQLQEHIQKLQQLQAEKEKKRVDSAANAEERKVTEEARKAAEAIKQKKREELLQRHAQELARLDQVDGNLMNPRV